MTEERHSRLPLFLLGIAALCSGAGLVALGSKLTFYIDDWDLLLHRPGYTVAAFLDPHVGHNDASLVAIYKLLQETFGMDSITPFIVVAIAWFLAAAVTLFFYLRSRVGEWLALAGAVSILFFGAAYEDLLIPFQISFYAPIACGLAALMAIERRTRNGDLLACVLLVFSLTINGLGLAFVVACAIVLATHGRRRLWVVAVPAILFALWFAGWGHDDPQSRAVAAECRNGTGLRPRRVLLRSFRAARACHSSRRGRGHTARLGASGSRRTRDRRAACRDPPAPAHAVVLGRDGCRGDLLVPDRG